MVFQIRSDLFRLDQIRSDKIIIINTIFLVYSDQIRSDLFRSDQTRSDLFRSDHIRSYTYQSKRTGPRFNYY